MGAGRTAAGAAAELAPFPQAEVPLPPTEVAYQNTAQTYTPEFKRWFGNWEKDPANASKVVDEAGKPKVMYHGTSAHEFSEFAAGAKERGDFGLFGDGAYFTSDPSVASGYVKTDEAHTKQLFKDAHRLRNEYDKRAEAEGKQWH